MTITSTAKMQVSFNNYLQKKRKVDSYLKKMRKNQIDKQKAILNILLSNGINPDEESKDKSDKKSEKTVEKPHPDTDKLKKDEVIIL
jgi:hypothetical protein